MKKFLSILFLCAFEATASPLTDDIDKSYAAVWEVVMSTKQAAYLADKGAYAQLFWSHTKDNTPVDGVSVVPDNLLDKPSDQLESWGYFLDLSTTPLRCRISVNVYTEGYIVILEVIDDGKRMQRAIDVGPSGRSLDWHEIKEMEPQE